MLNSWHCALLVGTVLGTLSGLGVGGGSLLVLWLTMVLNMGYSTARGINLLFFLPAAAVACTFRWKQGILNFKQVLPAILSGCAAAVIGTFFSMSMNITLFKKLFGILLILTGLRELFYRTRPEIN